MVETIKQKMGAKLSTERDAGTAADGGSRTGTGPAAVLTTTQSNVHEENVEIRKEGESSEELSVHFEYKGKGGHSLTHMDSILSGGATRNTAIEDTFSVSLPNNGWKRSRRNNSFTSLSGAALGANATLANSSICNGKLGEQILPGLDSPKTFRRVDSILRTSSLKSDLSSLKLGSTLSMGSQSVPTELGELERRSLSNMNRSFLNANDVQMAGGAAGEDRVQAVCSEDNGWLFCGIYDGFNGRDAADYLAATLYENIGLHLRFLEWKMQRQQAILDSDSGDDTSMGDPDLDGHTTFMSPQGRGSSIMGGGHMDIVMEEANNIHSGWPIRLNRPPPSQSTIDFHHNHQNHHHHHELDDSFDDESLDDQFRRGVLDALRQSLVKTETDFQDKVEHEMGERPDLVMVGSCVLVLLMYSRNLYTLNLGDSRAVLATSKASTTATKLYNGSTVSPPLHAMQLTEQHIVDNAAEQARILGEHPEDARAISNGRLKGKLRVTRAFGAGYLKKVSDYLIN